MLLCRPFLGAVVVIQMNGPSLWEARLNIMAVIYMLQTAFTITLAVVISSLDLTYHCNSRMSQRQSTESQAGPKTKIRRRHSWAFALNLRIMMRNRWHFHIWERKWRNFWQMKILPMSMESSTSKENWKNSMKIMFILLKGKAFMTQWQWQNKTSQILRSYFNSQAKDEEAQKHTIVETAARLIKSDIKSHVPTITDQYSSAKLLTLGSALSFLPDTTDAVEWPFRGKADKM